jgi:nitroreductase
MNTDSLLSLEETAKWAETVPGVHDLIRQRWSPRSFAKRDISDHELIQLLEAARWASSSNNEQPWRFLLARRSDSGPFRELLAVLYPANQLWAQNASVLLFTATKKTYTGTEINNRFADHDAGQAIAQLTLQATSLGIYGHALGGFDHELARKVLQVPADFELGPGLALGYPGSIDLLPPELRDRELARRERKPLTELVFGAKWNSEPPLDLSQSAS